MINKKIEEFSLLGGPLHRLGGRLGLVLHKTNTLRLGFALGFTAWVVLIILTLIEGNGSRIFTLALVAGHMRLLVVIPLFFLCEAMVDPRMTAFIKMIVASDVVPQHSVSTLKYELSRVSRLNNSWGPDATFLFVAVMLSSAGSFVNIFGLTATYRPTVDASEMTMAGWWYWNICLTLFRFLMLRWIWRLCLWAFTLWRISRMQLNLVPTHPDGAAGLGYLEVVQAHFMPLVFAISVLQAAMFTEEIYTGRMVLEDTYPVLILILVIDAVLFLGPLFIFSSKLWASRVNGLSNYMIFAASYVKDFDKKWLSQNAKREEPLLGTADLQSLADLGNSINVVRNMNWVPLSTRTLAHMALIALLPMLPLLLLKYPVTELAEKFFTNLIGL
jgi:hypothetical protein